MDTITSTANPVVKRLRALRDAKERAQAGQFLVEGAVMLREALKCGLKPCEALMENADDALARALMQGGAKVYTASRAAIEVACDTRTPQGVCASFALPESAWTRDDARLTAAHKIVALDGVQDPGNLGTIWRTADAAGLDALLLGAGCADPYAPKVQRAAMGSGFRVPISRTDSLADALRARRDEGYTVVVSALDGAPLETRGELGDKWVLVIGSEAHGVSEEVRKEADMRVKIPMRGGAESLNAAVAAGILMYELTRPSDRA